MTEQEREELAESIATLLTMGQKDHDDHHKFIKAFMLREEKKQERWEKIQTSLIGSIALVALGGVGKLVIMGFDSWVGSK